MADYKAIKGHTIQTVAGDPGTIADGLIIDNSVTVAVSVVVHPGVLLYAACKT